MPRSEGSFIRWQAITLTQLGYAVNLILGSATASLGFALTLVKDKEYAPGCWGKCLWGLCVLLVSSSIGFGLLCVLNRLTDFRKTKDIARDREKWEAEGAAIDRRLDGRMEETKKLGKRTWVLFYWQVSTFALGVLLLIGVFVVAYRAKLF